MSLFALAHQSCDSAVRYANSSRSLQLQHGLDSAFGYPPINRLYANSKHLSNFCTGVEFQLCVIRHAGGYDAISHNPSSPPVLLYRGRQNVKQSPKISFKLSDICSDTQIHRYTGNTETKETQDVPSSVLQNRLQCKYSRIDSRSNSEARRAKLTGSKLIKKYKQAELVKIVKLGELSL